MLVRHMVQSFDYFAKIQIKLIDFLVEILDFLSPFQNIN